MAGSQRLGDATIRELPAAIIAQAPIPPFVGVATSGRRQFVYDAFGNQSEHARSVGIANKRSSPDRKLGVKV
jgi:hypothetical protein